MIIEADQIKALEQSVYKAIDSVMKSSPVLSSGGVAVACSGGSDSLFLTLMLKSWCDVHGISYVALIVDHGLRAESQSEASDVMALLVALGIDAIVLTLRASDFAGAGSLQEKARNARYSALEKACLSRDISHLFLGHHMGDQVETFFMRLKSKSGLAGLCGMSSVSFHGNLTLCRPLLGINKSDIISYLAFRKISYVTDPSNSQERFQRVRSRNMVEKMLESGELCLSATVASMGKLQSSYEALLFYAHNFLKKSLCGSPGFISFNREDFLALPIAVREIVILKGFHFLLGEGYPPKSRKMCSLLLWVQDKEGSRAYTLGGCLFYRYKEQVLMCRESVDIPVCYMDVGMTWDRRFNIETNQSLCVHSLGVLRKLGYHIPSLKYLDVPVCLLDSLPVFCFERGAGKESAFYIPPFKLDCLRQACKKEGTYVEGIFFGGWDYKKRQEIQKSVNCLFVDRLFIV